MNALDWTGVAIGLLLCGLLASNGWLAGAGVLAFLYAIWRPND